MKKIFLQYNNDWKQYCCFKEFLTKNSELHFVALALDPIEDLEVRVEADKYSVLISSRNSFKTQAKIEFKTLAEKYVFDSEYEKYCDKREKEMPKVEISLDDYEELQQKWKKIKQEKPAYVIFTLDDSGPLDKVDVIGKDDLSDQDLADIKHEHEKYLAWQKAEQLYNSDHEIIDDIWHSPVDSVYDADIANYLGREVGFVQHKKYTKQEILTELQEKLRKNESVYLIIHWLYVRRGYGIEDADESFLELLQQFGYMDMGWEPMISHEQLQDISNRLMLGQDVTLDSVNQII